MYRKILICIHPGHGRLAAQMLTKSRELAAEVCAMAFSQEDIQLARKYGADKIFYLEINDIISLRYVSAISDVIKLSSPDIVLYPSTRLFKSVSSRVAVRFSCGLTADCINLYVGDDGRFYQQAPAFIGNAVATILSESKIQMASVLENVFQEKNYTGNEKHQDVILIPNEEDRAYRLISEKQTSTSRNNKSVILAAGFGIRSREYFEKLTRLASLIGADLGATMAAVDAGFAPREFLIGQSGNSVSPALYVAFGISGQLQHRIGVNAGKIISVNKDLSAPMNSYADYVINDDCRTVIDRLLDYKFRNQ